MDRTYTAEVGISPKIALGDMCQVTVVAFGDVLAGMQATDTTLPIDGDHTREQVIEAAEDVLTANGWKVTGEWQDGDNSYYARAAKVADESVIISSAREWAEALDAHQKETGQSAGDIISWGYADGEILGVALDPNHPDADDERAVIASESGWLVRYVPQSGWWEAVEADPEAKER